MNRWAIIWCALFHHRRWRLFNRSAKCRCGLYYRQGAARSTAPDMKELMQ